MAAAAAAAAKYTFSRESFYRFLSNCKKKAFV